jgi:hypothetical protein
MKRNKMTIRIYFPVPIFFLLIVFTLFAGCNGNPFIGNIFEGIDDYTLDVDLEEASTNDLINEYENGGDDFLDEIDTEEEYATVTSTLNTTVSDPNSTPSQVQDAAVLLSDVYLHQSGLDDTLDEASANVTEIAGEQFDGPADIADLVFGEDATEEEIVFGLTSLLGSADALEAYGNTLDVINPPPDTDSTLLGVQALASGVFSLMIDDMMDSGSYADEDEAKEELAVYLYDPEQPNPADTNFDFLDISDDMTDEEVETQLETGLGTGLTNVIMEGGITNIIQNF